MREAIVETYYIPPPVGTAPVFVSPTPRPTNTPGPTNTQASVASPTSTLEPRCDMIWISNPNANLDSNYIQFEIKAYDWDEWPQELFFNMTVDEVEIWQDEEVGPWVVTGINWETWDESGTLYERYDSYGDDWYYLDYYPEPPFVERRCFGGVMCGGAWGYQYNGRMTIYFGQELQGEYSIIPWINFTDYGIRCQEWVPWTSPNWITNTPGSGGDPPEDPTASPIPPTEGTSPPSTPDDTPEGTSPGYTAEPPPED